MGHNKIVSPLIILKYSGIAGLIILLICWLTMWKKTTVAVGLVLVMLTVSWRTFKWWVYRGTINMGKKRQLKKSKSIH